MTSQHKTWTATVDRDPETEEWIINFPDDMMEEMGWRVGDTLDWSQDSDGTIILKKVE